MAYYKFLFLFLDVLCAKLVVAICEFFWAKLLVLFVVVCSSKNYNSLSEKGPTSTSHKSNLSTNKIELPNCLVRHGPNPGPNQNPELRSLQNSDSATKMEKQGVLDYRDD